MYGVNLVSDDKRTLNLRIVAVSACVAKCRFPETVNGQQKIKGRPAGALFYQFVACSGAFQNSDQSASTLAAALPLLR